MKSLLKLLYLSSLVSGLAACGAPLTGSPQAKVDTLQAQSWFTGRPKSLRALTATIDGLERRYRRSNDARAFFATTYLITTRNIIRAMDLGVFADRPRMERMTLAFGNLWLDALEAQDGGRRDAAPPAWRLAFGAGLEPSVSPARVLMLSINAHVIRDLPFAVAATATPDAALEPDFKSLNRILGDEVPEVRQALVSRYGNWSRDLVERWDDRLPGLAMGAARDLSWRLAVQLHRDPVAGPEVIEERALASGKLVDRPVLLDAVWAWMRWTTKA